VNRAFTKRIVGKSEAESERLLLFLTEQASIPEYQCRVRWEPDTVVFWDNRAVQHYGVSDYYPARRVMERVTIAGDEPV
jgi:taurine dioxygenase